MKSLKEALVKKNQKLKQNFRISGPLNRKRAIQYAKDALKAMDEYSDLSLEDQYEAALDNLYHLSTANDQEIAALADAALASDTDDMWDRLEEFTDVIVEISELR